MTGSYCYCRRHPVERGGYLLRPTVEYTLHFLPVFKWYPSRTVSPSICYTCSHGCSTLDMLLLPEEREAVLYLGAWE